MTQSPLPIAVLISGGGRTLANLIRHRDAFGLPIEVRLVIASRDDIAGVDIARAAGLRTMVIPKDRSMDDPSYSRAVFDPIRAVDARYVVMAGFLKHVMIPDDFENRVINIHPSLLPAFGGAGMYGDRVHDAVIRRNVALSGCTVHYVDNHYDNGPIIHQRWCEIAPDETATSLAAKVFELECEALPKVLNDLASIYIDPDATT